MGQQRLLLLMRFCQASNITGHSMRTRSPVSVPDFGTVWSSDVQGKRSFPCTESRLFSPQTVEPSLCRVYGDSLSSTPFSSTDFPVSLHLKTHVRSIGGGAAQMGPSCGFTLLLKAPPPPGLLPPLAIPQQTPTKAAPHLA